MTLLKTVACLTVVMTLACPSLRAEELVISLYDGAAPGSEDWKQTEKVQTVGSIIVTNVAKPTLTVFEPEASQANGAAAIICPGGGFHLLEMGNEGYDVAKWLASKGVKCFVLKYRLVETKTDSPIVEMFINWLNFDKIVAPIVKLATADGSAAVAYVRDHAAELSINPDKIGILGFSAGGQIAASVACTDSEEARPDFVASLYPNWPENSPQVPSGAPPLFVAAATDDPLDLGPHGVRLYQQWVAAKKPAELHMFAKGGHGFGMRKQNLPSDKWIEQFAAWLSQLGMLQPEKIPPQ